MTFIRYATEAGVGNLLHMRGQNVDTKQLEGKNLDKKVCRQNLDLKKFAGKILI